MFKKLKSIIPKCSVKVVYDLCHPYPYPVRVLHLYQSIRTQLSPFAIKHIDGYMTSADGFFLKCIGWLGYNHIIYPTTNEYWIW